MTGDVYMKMSRCFCIGWAFFLLLFPHILSAQDIMPDVPEVEKKKNQPRQLKEIRKADSIFAYTILPKPFIGVCDNYIMDESLTLDPLFERMRLLRIGANTDTLHILHIGDSHVRGHIFPQTAGEKLKKDFGAIKYTDMGVNGATCLTFTHPDRIAGITALNPDLIILSFGTNESHNRRYNENIHYSQMDELVKFLQARLPDTPILLTTPPGSYESFRQRRGRRRTYSINPRTPLAVENILRYAKNNKLAVWNLYEIIGGKNRACKNWLESGLMRPDHVHYLPEGYVLQGELLYEAIIKSYNTYVSF